jgi:hypothetical protein
MKHRTLSLMLATLFCGCQAGRVTSTAVRSDQAASSGSSFTDPRGQEDRLRGQYPRYDYSTFDESPALGTAFAAVRQDAGWKAFVDALVACDATVNGLLEEDITDWTQAGRKIDAVNSARNAWRRACTYGVVPPELPRGWTEFMDGGIRFRLHVKSSTDSVLIARSPRGQVMGIFELQLWDDGDQHLMAHMLQGVIRNPDRYLNYPWNVVMATDTIFIDDIWVELDRINRSVKMKERFGDEEVSKP